MNPIPSVLVDILTSTFDGKWQSTKRNQFSPTGGQQSIPKIFGLGKHDGERKNGGEERLIGVINELFEYLKWVDTLKGRGGHDPSIDLPLHQIQEHLSRVVDGISSVQPCQFNLFRLGVFTTVITGCGLLKAGHHLRQLAIPAPDCASLNHLCECGIQQKDHDVSMKTIAQELGIPYHRDVIETLLVSKQILYIIRKIGILTLFSFAPLKV